jgi:type IV pilus assembly protein PilX
MQLSARTTARCAPTRQRGVIVFIALIVLVAMTLAALGVIRSTDTGNLIAGNLAFKQETANASETVLESTYRLLLQADGLGTGALNNDNVFAGYHSSQPNQPENTANYSDPTWFQANGACAVAGCLADANGNVSYYVVHRMCTQANTAYNGTGGTGVQNQCATLAATNPAQDGNSQAVGGSNFQPPPQLYYRVTTLVKGPRNSQSVVQAMLVFSN